jgi:Ca2+-transporting ATPase
VQVTGEGYDPTTGAIAMPDQTEARQQLQLLLIGAALCSNAHLVHPLGSSRWQEMGDPTEAALLVAALKAHLNLEDLQTNYPRQREVPFDSRRRMMTVVLNWQHSEDLSSILPNSSYLSFTKGAPLEVSRRCQSILRLGHMTELTPSDRQAIIAANDRLAQEGFRVLGFGTAPLLDWQIALLFLCPPILLGAEELRKLVIFKTRSPSSNLVKP